MLGATIQYLSIGPASEISIHAPVLGATLLTMTMTRPYLQFQSTHPCWVRRPASSAPAFPGYFNPRTRAGCDQQRRNGTNRFFAISIHAPVLGATRSNPIRIKCLRTFQSTHPCWVRRCFCRVFGECCQISIHAPVLGATQRVSFLSLTGDISIHAPVLGATAAHQQAAELTN